MIADPILPAIRAELDQTPAWWDRQYDALVRKQIPRGAEYHAEHDVDEPVRSWGGSVISPAWCATCGVRIEGEPGG